MKVPQKALHLERCNLWNDDRILLSLPFCASLPRRKSEHVPKDLRVSREKEGVYFEEFVFGLFQVRSEEDALRKHHSGVPVEQSSGRPSKTRHLELHWLKSSLRVCKDVRYYTRGETQATVGVTWRLD